ncbi:MAG: hypothetical protein MI757_07740, partial [Pirellulales bacterium]|nr:hypothetical protein [Pirellulales bacterium]
NSADFTAMINADGSSTLNSTSIDNSFINSGAGEEFQMDSLSATTRVRLDFSGNVADNSASDYNLIETSGTFTVQLLTPDGDGNSILTENTGTFTIDPDITNDPGGIPLPP